MQNAPGGELEISEPQLADDLCLEVRQMVGLGEGLTDHLPGRCALGRTRPRLLSAVAELTTNSVVHGAGSDTLRIGAESDRIVCEVHDSGQLNDPLAGRRPSHPTQPRGRGLLLVHPLADLVRVHTGPDGTTVRRHLPG
ncbi:ATP-binding protein [Streptomyces griseoaurantiacus]|uniref:ATP-binding protein n=1 Tax=Streptomyces griseoaurantiacus TaxID=68213 RepID=A0A7W2HSX7_9ACTN|nr:ATP-binding protein [Streptomyces griseoaurantiacus]